MADDRIRWDENPVRLGKKGFVTWKTAMNELNKRVGLLKNLKPSVEDKTNIVNAISGVSERVGILKNLKTAVKTSIVNAINELHKRLDVTSRWLGEKSEVSSTTLTHGNTVSALIEYLANKPSSSDGFFVGGSNTRLSGTIASKGYMEFQPTATLPENAGYRVITLASIPFAQGGDGYLNPAITWSCQKNGTLRADNFTDAEQNIGSGVVAIIIGVKIPL